MTEREQPQAKLENAFKDTTDSAGAGATTSSALKLPPAHSESDVFKLMVANVRDYAIFMLDPDGNVMTWNAGAQRIKGYTADEIIGKHFSTFYTQDAKDIRHPDHELEIARKDGRYEEEGWRVKKDGSLFWANIVITAIRNDDGELVGFAKVTRDLTERRKTEEEKERALRENEIFQLMVANVKDYAIFMLDPSGNVKTWNEGAQRIKGFTADEIIGKHFSTFYTQEAKDRNHPAYELEVAAHEGKYEEGWRVRKDGSLFWANVLITAVRRDGELLGFAKVTRDLTERKRAETELRETNEELARANSAKDVFLANMSHELRTPLNSIIGFNDVMLLGMKEPLTEGQTKQAMYIKRAAEHLLSLINDILDLAKIESGKMDLTLVPMDIDKLISDVVAGLQPQANDRGLKVVADKSACPATVLVDERSVRQILTNLISNAIKFTDRGGATIECDTDSSYLYVRVIDTGIGISKEDQSKLFKGFVQLARATRKQEGTGLGLALSRRLAQLMHGDITVESDTDKGSTFTLQLPLVRE